MPCRCITGCINKKCSCCAKNEICTQECINCVNNNKYKCHNLMKNKKQKEEEKHEYKKKLRNYKKNNSKKLNIQTVEEDSSDSSYFDDEDDINENENENEINNKKTNELIFLNDKKKSEQLAVSKEKNIQNESQHSSTPQTIIINNYYSFNRFEQKNISTTHITNNFNSSELPKDQKENNKEIQEIQNIKILKENTINTNNNINIPEDFSQNNFHSENFNSNCENSIKLTNSLAQDFLRFYWECLSSINKTNELKKYIYNNAIFIIQGNNFNGVDNIMEALLKASPIKLNNLEHQIYPYNPISSPFQTNNNSLQLLPNQQNKSLQECNTIQNKDNINNIIDYTIPNIQPLGSIESHGMMTDINNNSVEFQQKFFLIYNTSNNLIQIEQSELLWL